MRSRRIAVVTGASKGIGRGIGLRLARSGFSVVVNYASDRSGAEETAEGVAAEGSEALLFQADVGVLDDVNAMFDYVLEKWGTPELLVNNAGVQTWKPLLELEEAEWDRTIRTNLKGTFLCTQRAAREMSSRDDGGCIVNIGSGCNKGPFPKLVDYSASKGGIELLTRVSAVELGPLGIRVNCVAPGAIEIERTRQEAPNYAATWGPITPLRRVGQVEDVADVVAFLASEGGKFLTAQTIYVDGGLFSQMVWPYEQEG